MLLQSLLLATTLLTPPADSLVEMAGDRLHIVLHTPGNGFYRGTRFDRAGVFDSIIWEGTEMAGRWFETYDPYQHDAVLGPAEEFSPQGYEEAALGGTFLKIGVGKLVRTDGKPYNRFSLYPIQDSGQWTVRSDGDTVTFTQVLPEYTYRKEVFLTSDHGFAIRHTLVNTGEDTLSGEVYNHNFFTLGRLGAGPDWEADLPFPPVGIWRGEYDSVESTREGFRFSRPLEGKEWIQMNDVRSARGGILPYRFTVRDKGTGLSVRVRGDCDMDHAVFWANARIACLEPYNRYDVAPGTSFTWRIDYTFGNTQEKSSSMVRCVSRYSLGVHPKRLPNSL